MWASHFGGNVNYLSISSSLTTEVQIFQNVGLPNNRLPNILIIILLYYNYKILHALYIIQTRVIYMNMILSKVQGGRKKWAVFDGFSTDLWYSHNILWSEVCDGCRKMASNLSMFPREFCSCRNEIKM